MLERNGTRLAGERQRLLDGLAAELPDMQRRALVLDRAAALPERDLALLRTLGALAAPLPAALGGLGMGTEPEGAAALLGALRLIGRGNLSLGRIYEGHVNALRLVVRYGAGATVRAAAEDALAGHLFGLWVTDAPEAPLRLGHDLVLRGAKGPCSGAGAAARALVTATTEDGASRMLVVAAPPPGSIDLADWDPHGMRATGSGRVRFDGMRVATAALVGGDGDYLRQPDFSGGAWRASAVALGGLEALVAEARRLLRVRGRQDDPHQRARIGEMLIAEETARLWLGRAAAIAEANAGDADDAANYVNLARLAVEAACLDAIRLAQRALGLASFRRGTQAELLFRDLGIYLRQPAPDLALTEAAAHFMRRPLPAPA